MSIATIILVANDWQAGIYCEIAIRLDIRIFQIGGVIMRTDVPFWQLDVASSKLMLQFGTTALFTLKPL